MERRERGNIAICCTSGGYKNVFTHGVLKALEERGYRADAYAACSSSVLIAAFAAMGRMDALDLQLWKKSFEIGNMEGNSQSEAILYSIGQTVAAVKENLWLPASSRLLIATSFVKTVEAASITQSEQAKKLGRQLVINSLQHNSSWGEAHLQLRMFDTRPSFDTRPLTTDNFEEVAYATTRFLRGWYIPAFIENEPYIDGCYTCMSPVLPLAGLGYKKIICITNEHDRTPLDFFSSEFIQEKEGNSSVRIIKPDVNLKEIGVDYLTFDRGCLEKAFRQGYENGSEVELF